jgi:hypothetical protein
VPSRSGLVSASVLTMVLVGAFSGALVSLVLASVLRSHGLLAIVSAFIAVILALCAGRAVLRSHVGLSFQSLLVIWNIVVASSVGALAGHELGVDLRSPPASVLIGSMAGLLASALFACFAIEIFYITNRQRND